MRCTAAVDFMSPYIGEDGDSFIVILRIHSLVAAQNEVDENVLFKRTGSRDLFRSIWTCQKTVRCGHHQENPQEMILEPGLRAVPAEEDTCFQNSSVTRCIYLTASNSAARWQALVNVLYDGCGRSFRPTMVRGRDCCLKCAVDQTIRRSGFWCLVL
jgi:hypothetical protein